MCRLSQWDQKAGGRWNLQQWWGFQHHSLPRLRQGKTYSLQHNCCNTYSMVHFSAHPIMAHFKTFLLAIVILKVASCNEEEIDKDKLSENREKKFWGLNPMIIKIFSHVVSWLKQDHGALFTKFIVQRSWPNGMETNKDLLGLDLDNDLSVTNPVLLALRSQGKTPTKPIFRKSPKFSARRRPKFYRNA